MDLSRIRRQVNRSYAQIGARLEALLNRSPLFAASLYEHKSRCGNPQCRCARGSYRHRQWCVSFVQEGRSRTRVVPRGIRPQVERLTREYRRVRRARREVATLFAELLEAADALARARCAAGAERFARLVDRARARVPRPPTEHGG